jgi:hypothetical protein
MQANPHDFNKVNLLSFKATPILLTLLGVLVCLLFAAGGGTAHAATASAATACSSTFKVLDNTAYSDVAIGGCSIKVNFIPARYCQPLTWDSTTSKVKMPSQADWQNLINTYDPTPANAEGYLILDCEKLYLTGSSATVANRLAILKQLQQWAQDIRPNRVLGWYGLINKENISTDAAGKIAAYNGIAQLMDLHPGYTAYFPTLYMKANATSPYTGYSFSTELNNAIAQANTVDTGGYSTTGTHPLFPYLWPQNYDAQTTLVTGVVWQSWLNTIRSTSAAGFVIWGGQNPAVAYNASNGGYGDWVGVTQTFLQSL